MVGNRDHEPSMEEILSSIKRIIAEDGEKARIAPARRAPANRAPAAAEPDILELTELADVMTDAITGAIIDDGDEMDNSRDHAARRADEGMGAEEPLVDAGTAQSLRHSLSALATLAEPGAQPQIVRSGETSLEGLVRDMLRPMLKDWLDANLPAIVERAIAKEIGRITKGR